MFNLHVKIIFGFSFQGVALLLSMFDCSYRLFQLAQKSEVRMSLFSKNVRNMECTYKVIAEHLRTKLWQQNEASLSGLIVCLFVCLFYFLVQHRI